MPNLTEADVAQALKHSLRRQLMRTFRLHRLLSPTEAAELLDVPLVTVSYHVRVLVKYNFLLLRAQQQVKGALKNFYLPNDEVLNSSIVKEFVAENPSMGLD